MGLWYIKIDPRVFFHVLAKWEQNKTLKNPARVPNYYKPTLHKCLYLQAAVSPDSVLGASRGLAEL